ncbi:hypothetical protein C4K04_2661 [Pseudomonas chlororaphis]|uniref:Uncharacterized protein n=1 Tax=Pseudomonas chlororaphis TaxID=587753 RepID=A0A3G7TML9_9PSED|nr:hypothetical protein [Pseudomonas chlororaphis]AZE48333.1 hypothetical protein C4K04_2661 [Pseudomonas chlororaphis]
MTYLRAVPGAIRHYTGQHSSSGDADDHQQRYFNELLRKPVTLAETVARNTYEPRDRQRSRPDLAPAFAPQVATLSRLGRFNPDTLTLRLTNGPLAGLEIEASAHGSLLSLRVTVNDLNYFERIAGPREILESELAALFNRPVTLEVCSATTEPE